VARNTAVAPPTDDDMLIQARMVGAKAFVAVEIRAGVGTARLVGVDGRERDRRSVTVGDDLAPLAAAVYELLAPPPRTRWYESRWAWAAGAAVIVAAIVIPVTAQLTHNPTPSTLTVKPVYTWP